MSPDQREQLVRLFISLAIVLVAAGGIYAVLHLEGSC